MQTEGDAQRFVRVKRLDPRGFVEFEFSIGEPSLVLDMILPPPAFRAFCRDQRVHFLEPGGPKNRAPLRPVEET